MSQFTTQSRDVAASAFSTNERAVIEYWLNRPNDLPEPESAVAAAVRRLGLDGARAYAFGVPSAAVAQIALAAVDGRLPQWALVYPDKITLGRDVGLGRDRSHRPVQLISRFLFSLDWAATVPGISWPRDYYATRFRAYRIWVVTASSYTTDLWGVLDVAAGGFPESQAFQQSVREVIVSCWRHDEWLEPAGAWEYFWEAGLVAESEARAWHQEIWPEEVLEEDERAEENDYTEESAR